MMGLSNRNTIRGQQQMALISALVCSVVLRCVRCIYDNATVKCVEDSLVLKKACVMNYDCINAVAFSCCQFGVFFDAVFV